MTANHRDTAPLLAPEGDTPRNRLGELTATGEEREIFLERNFGNCHKHDRESSSFAFCPVSDG